MNREAGEKPKVKMPPATSSRFARSMDTPWLREGGRKDLSEGSMYFVFRVSTFYAVSLLLCFHGRLLGLLGLFMRLLSCEEVCLFSLADPILLSTRL